MVARVLYMATKVFWLVANVGYCGCCQGFLIIFCVVANVLLGFTGGCQGIASGLKVVTRVF